MTELTQKLHPRRFTEMSPKMAAIVGCILGERFTTPTLAELAITSDGIVLGRAEGDCGMNEWIGSAADLERNWRSLLRAAELTLEERTEAEGLYRVRVTDWREDEER